MRRLAPGRSSQHARAVRRRPAFSAVLAAVTALAVGGCGRNEPADPAKSAPAGPSSPSTLAPAKADAAQGRRLAEQMLDALNAGDAELIKSHECADSTGIGGRPAVELPRGGRVNVRLDPEEIVSREGFLGADLTGSVDGKRVQAGRISMFREDDGWCVFTLYVL